MVTSNVNKNKKSFQLYVSYRPLYAILSLPENVALCHNQVWQCNSIATIKFSFTSLN